MTDYDMLVIGAGVVGLAIAQKAASENLSVLVCERHPSFANETSSRNSEVIHAGIYYPDNSLKAKLCVPGNKKLYEWCNRYDVPHKRTGKFIIATAQDEVESLHKIYSQGQRNGVEELQFISSEILKTKEPYINAAEAVYSPNTGIVDSHKLMESFIEKAKENNCDFAYKHSVSSIKYNDNFLEVIIIDPEGEPVEINVKYAVNAAGLDSDTVAQAAGIDIDEAGYRLNYCRGHYFRIKSSKKHLANHLIYPVPPADKSGLGIHITIDMNGELKLGPDTQYLKDRVQDYSVSENLQEKFFSAASRYVKGLEFDDIFPDQSGIRPKLQVENGPVRDFIINEESSGGLPGLINLIGIESPGLTCSLEIADFVMNYIE
jgi:L-2-hydroxyglutarate oxidase LhgO